MKRVLGLVVAAVLMASQVCAVDFTGVNEYSYEIENTSGTSAKTQVVPVTSIRPGVDKITRFEVTALQGLPGAECWGALFDDTTLACTGEKIGEMEAGNGFTAYWLPGVRSKKILNGVVAMQGVRTRLTIYFVSE